VDRPQKEGGRAKPGASSGKTSPGFNPSPRLFSVKTISSSAGKMRGMSDGGVRKKSTLKVMGSIPSLVGTQVVV
jgi:hypothetical protein